MEHSLNRKIVLEDGTEYHGVGFGSDASRVCELVFNTSMTGYQEIISDPSYTDQAVVMTYPLIGNYGMADEDYETKIPTIGALIVREYNDLPSNFRCTKTLSEVLEEYGIPGLQGVDTRAITRRIRDRGTCSALICDIDVTVGQARDILRAATLPHDQVSRVSCRKKWCSHTANALYSVVAVDCGIKLNIVRSLNDLGCNVTVVPWNTSPEEIRRLHPDGVLLSNGPGDPEDAVPVIETVRALRGEYPIFGICLGHQIIGLSYGAKIMKMKFGHRGGNHPVRNLTNGKIEITSQNHSYAVIGGSLDGTPLEPTHINLLDGTVEGMRCPGERVFSVQYHPESAPGPQDSGYLFRQFLEMMKEAKANGKAD